jgi:hypothetical protein
MLTATARMRCAWASFSRSAAFSSSRVQPASSFVTPRAISTGSSSGDAVSATGPPVIDTLRHPRLLGGTSHRHRLVTLADYALAAVRDSPTSASALVLSQVAVRRRTLGPAAPLAGFADGATGGRPWRDRRSPLARNSSRALLLIHLGSHGIESCPRVCDRAEALDVGAHFPYGVAVLKERDAVEGGICARHDGRHDAAHLLENTQSLVDADARLRLAADGRDKDADERDADANERDRSAHGRDVRAEVRDAAVSDQPDMTGTRRFAAQDRHAAAEDREAAAYERLNSRVDRKASGWDRSISAQLKAQLFEALEHADQLADATLCIGQAQGILMSASGGNAAEAMTEIGNRADRGHVGLEEAARQILAEGAASKISDIRRSSVMPPPYCAEECSSGPPLAGSAGGGEVVPLGAGGVGR